jgi:hypothetical protein
MCRAVRCKTCGKTSWAGCGQHVSQVKASVPHDQWCSGHPEADRVGGGLLARLLGR